MNAHYDLGQIYLSRAFNYDLAVTHFEYIFNNIYSTYGSVNPDLGIKSLPELKEKSLFMLGYIYHNHIGNFTLAQNYYSVAATAIFEATGTNTHIKFFGRMVNDSAILQIETAHAQSCVTLIKLD